MSPIQSTTHSASPLQGETTFLIGRYYFEIVTVLALAIIAYAILNIAQVHMPDLSRLWQVITAHPYAFGSAALVTLVLVPLIMSRFSQKHAAEWNTSSVPTSIKMVGLVVRSVFALAFDIALLPAAGVLSAIAFAGKSNLDPQGDEINKDLPPLILFHGNDFNETEFYLGLFFFRVMNRGKFGSVFTFNYDKNPVFHDHNLGPDDIANNEGRAKVKEVLSLTGQKSCYALGHSMGGLVIAELAHNVLREGTIQAAITICTPWQGSKLIQFPSLLSKRFQQMAEGSEYLESLNAKATEAISKGTITYYNIASTVDYMVSDEQGLMSAPLSDSHKRVFSYLGHYGVMGWPPVWMQVCDWLKELYPPNSTEGAPANSSDNEAR